MFATGLIVFRESLEAALFIGIMAAATRMLPRRGWWIVLGVLAGIIGSVLIALSIGAINDMADGAGQDWLTVMVLSLALCMLIWHVIWANQHGRALAHHAKTLGQSVADGKKTLTAVSIAIAMIVLREGAETVLFVSGSLSAAQAPVAEVVAAPPAELATSLDLTQSNTSNALPTTIDLTQTQPNGAAGLPTSLDLTGIQPNHTMESTDTNIAANNSAPQEALGTKQSAMDITIGGAIGLMLGVFVGLSVYFGLSKISVAKMFAITNGLVIVLAAGMAGQIGARLLQMGVIHIGSQTLWDSSRWLPNDSVFAVFLNALMGYTAQPSVLQVALFVLCVLGTVLAARSLHASVSP